MAQTITVFEIGEKVQQAIPILSGTIKDVRFYEGKPQYLMEYIDPETGDEDHRWFDADQLQSA